ncbi:hypothetical protein [Candidatus Poriferisodalis sp.]
MTAESSIAPARNPRSTAREAIAMMLDVDPADVGPIDVLMQEQGGSESLA